MQLLGQAIALHVGELDEISRPPLLSWDLQHLEMILVVMVILLSVRIYFIQSFSVLCNLLILATPI